MYKTYIRLKWQFLWEYSYCESRAWMSFWNFNEKLSNCIFNSVHTGNYGNHRIKKIWQLNILPKSNPVSKIPVNNTVWENSFPTKSKTIITYSILVPQKTRAGHYVQRKYKWWRAKTGFLYKKLKLLEFFSRAPYHINRHWHHY